MFRVERQYSKYIKTIIFYTVICKSSIFNYRNIIRDDLAYSDYNLLT